MELLLGKNHTRSSDPHIVTCSASAAMGISPGHKDFNEDALGYATADDRIFFALGDAHWGYHASEFAVRDSLRFLAETVPPQEHEPASWFRLICERINAALLRKAEEPDRASYSETTLLLLHLYPHKELVDGIEKLVNRVHYASFGDSFLYHFSKSGSARLVNRLESFWLGAQLARISRNNNLAAKLLEIGELILDPGDILLAASDGLPQCERRNVTALEPEDLYAILQNHKSPSDRCKALIDEALDYGGVDNIACVVYEQL